MNQLKALLFDVDGTLAETEEVHRLAFNRAFGEAGLDWTWDRQLYGKLLAVSGGRERIAHFIETCGATLPAGADAPALIAALHREKTRHYAAMLATGEIALRPGVERLLRQATGEGLRLAIVTTTSAANVMPLLQATVGRDAAQWFEVMCTAEQAPVKKPAPDAYLWTLQRLALAADRLPGDRGHGQWRGRCPRGGHTGAGDRKRLFGGRGFQRRRRGIVPPGRTRTSLSRAGGQRARPPVRGYGFAARLARRGDRGRRTCCATFVAGRCGRRR